MKIYKHAIRTTHKIALLMLLPAHAFATVYYYPYVGISGAGSAGTIGSGDPTIVYSNIVDQYPPTSRTSTRLVLSANAGYEFMGLSGNPSFDLGLGFYATPTGYHINGNLKESATGDPYVTLFTYSYQIETKRLMLEAQVNWILENFSPFLSGGVGMAWNTARSYSEAPISGTTYSPLTAFANKTTTNLAYQLGVGVGYSFSTTRNIKEDDFKPERITLGYRYANMGSVSFGTRDASYPYPLNVGSLSTNDIYLAYTHFF